METVASYASATLTFASRVLSFLYSIPGVSSTFGFFFGLSLGLLVGYFVFIFTLPTAVETPIVPDGFASDSTEIDEKTLKRILPEIPIWVKNPDYDRVDWINSLLRELWPFVDKAVEAQVRQQVTPLIAQYKPKALSSLEIEILSLGSLPPTLAGIKVYDTADDEMIMEPVLKWAGNPNIVVAAKALGVKATVQLTDLTVFLTARITLKPLVPVFPCFAKITVSIMEKPLVDFGLKLIGGDLMAIPGLYGFVQDTIANIVADKLLWPRALEVYKSDDALQGKKPIGWLTVAKLSAKNLKNIERFGFIDPYVVLSLGGQFDTKITTVKENTLNPSWKNDVFQMMVKDPETQILDIKVYDKEDNQADRFLSTQQVPLKGLVAGEPQAFDFHLLRSLKGPETTADGKAPSGSHNFGSMHMELTFKPFAEDVNIEWDDSQSVIPEGVPVGGGVLRVQVHSGDGLVGKHHSNPYVKVIFRNEEKKTKVVPKMTSAVFEGESFDFTVDEAPVTEELLVQAWSKNLGLSHYISSREPIGFVRIPLKDVVSNKRINDVYQLNESQSGKLKIELAWFEKK